VDVFECSTNSADVVFEYEFAGSGDPVVTLHARPFVTWYGPLVGQLTGWTVLRYRRVVNPRDGDFGIDDDAAAVAALLRHVGFARPHIVGHSYGGLVALALAMRGEPAVASLALLEPASSGFLAPEAAAAAMAPLLTMYRDEGAEAAMDQFLRLVCGADYRAVLERAVPGAFDDAAATAVQFFEVELPAVAQWSCVATDVEVVTQPVLNLLGNSSSPRFVESADLIQRWLPHAVRETISGGNHLLIADRPQAVAERLEAFWREL
jgi:pimeloyl-ACP methyl ester carboxylesterase